MNVEFPVFTCTRDSGEVTRFATIHELQTHLEQFDVENGEYFAWDKHGRPLALGVQQSVWLKVEPLSESAQPTLERALEKFASAIGVEGRVPDASATGLNSAYEAIIAQIKPARSSLLGRLFGRKG